MKYEQLRRFIHKKGRVCGLKISCYRCGLYSKCEVRDRAKTCQLCGGGFFKKPVFVLSNQPQSALHFPTTKDRGITIKVYQCKMCGLIQHTLPPIPNPYQNISPQLESRRTEWVKDFREYYNSRDAREERYSFNELEHYANLGEAIRRIHKQYKRVLVTVPNFRYPNEVLVDHLYYFTPETLRQSFELNGFSVDLCEVINQDNDIMLWAERRPQVDMSFRHQCLESIIRKLEDLCENNKVALWGAGHRALSLLCLGKITPAYIVDSSPSKQGKLSPVMLTPIYPEQQLIADPVDIVVIAVPETYKEEVVAKVKAMGLTSKLAFIGGKIEWITLIPNG